MQNFIICFGFGSHENRIIALLPLYLRGKAWDEFNYAEKEARFNGKGLNEVVDILRDMYAGAEKLCRTYKLHIDK